MIWNRPAFSGQASLAEPNDLTWYHNSCLEDLWKVVERATIKLGKITADNKGLLQKIGRVTAFVFVFLLSAAIFVWGDRIENLPVYGYPAVFLISFLGNLSVILPAPSYLVVFAAGATLDPIVIGIVAGLGATLGELSGYLAGASGKAVIEERPVYQRISLAISKWGMGIIFLLGVIPNFFFDIGGMLAGATRMSLWKFILAAWMGKSIRLSVVALIGSLTVV